MASNKAYVVLDADGFIVATHSGGPVCPINPPAGGRVETLDAKIVESAVQAMSRGYRVKKINGDEINIVEIPPPSRPAKPATLEGVKALRRKRMIEINNAANAARDQIFDAFPHVPLAGHNWGRHQHVLTMATFGKVALTDEFLFRNLKTGHFDRLTVQALIDQMHGAFLLFQKIYELDQSHRDQVQVIYDDDKKGDAQKIAEIEALDIPEYLGVDPKNSTAENLVIKGKS